MKCSVFFTAEKYLSDGEMYIC